MAVKLRLKLNAKELSVELQNFRMAMGLRKKICAVLALVLLQMACHPSRSTGDSRSPAVLITGASSGIGRATAEHLARSGYFVYAGARSQKDIDELSALPSVKGVRLDVTRAEEIEAAAGLIKEEGRPLVGLINNAGIAVVGPLSEIPESELSHQLDVNVLGPYRVTRAFTPLLIANKGRVINVGSINGFVSGGFFGPYAISKHALQAFSDSLAQELGPRGVKVVTVIPGGYQSRIFDELLAEGWTRETDFKAEMDRYVDQVSKRPARPPAELAPIIELALEDSDPRRKLYPGLSTQSEADLLMRVMTRRVAQLNHGHSQSFTREQLIQMLDQALEAYPARAGDQ